MIILDSDIMIDLLRQYGPAVAWLDALGEEEIILPGFVVMELLQGCSNKAEQEKVERVLAAFEIVWPSRRPVMKRLPFLLSIISVISWVYWML